MATFETLTGVNETMLSQMVLADFLQAGSVTDDTFLRSSIRANTVRQMVYDRSTTAHTDPGTDITTLSTSQANEYIDITPDVRIESTRMVSKEQVLINGNFNPLDIANIMAVDIRRQFENAMILLGCGNSTSQVTFDKDASTRDTKKAEAEAVLISLDENFNTNDIPTGDRFAWIHPSLFTWMSYVDGVVNGDLTGQAYTDRSGGSRAPFQEKQWHGMTLRSFSGPFKTNFSSNTSYATKYRQNLAARGSPSGAVYGLAVHRTAWAANFFNEVEVRIPYIEHKKTWAITGDLLVGTGITRTQAGAIQLIVGN